MIAYLKGTAKVYSDYLIIVTGGVGYKVFVGGKLLSRANNSEIEVFTYAYIREDRFELYGVSSENELKLFEMLLSVSGCGPKMALALTDAGTNKIIEAIQQADVTYFTQFPRVGKKLAQKLIIELKNKLGGLEDLDLSPKSETYEEVMAGLQVLGFGGPEIRTVLKEMDLVSMDTATAIKVALKKLKR
ncbi:Holliday junction branch migration protein RuvA [bacterium]|nr:Holliday junction branch migration protein RuvA [bacterium]